MIQITNPRRFRFISFLVIFLVLVMAVRFVWGASTLQRSGEVTVPEGASARKVWQTFVSEGYTTRTFPWRYQAWRQGAAAKIKAGTYRFKEGDKVRDAVRQLAEGDTVVTDVAVTFPEGFTLQQMAGRIASRGVSTADDFIAAAGPSEYVAQFPFLAGVATGRNLEGYLFPDTYRVASDDSSRDIVGRMLANFNSKVTAELQQEVQASNRTLDQVITMASIVEREVTSEEDMALVAGVLWKRFDEGMGLDADATVRYALSKWNEPLTINDLSSDSPYNTRKFRGLPPGPICNPGLRAIIATIRPESSEYYYYLSAPDGKTIFARTNDDHNVNKAKYLR